MGICRSPFFNIYISVQVLCFKAASSCPGHIFTPTCIYPHIPFISYGHQLCAIFPFIYPKCTNSSLHLSAEMQISSHSVNYACPNHQKTSTSLWQAKHLTCFLKVGSLVMPYKFISAQHMVNYNVYESTALKSK